LLVIKGTNATEENLGNKIKELELFWINRIGSDVPSRKGLQPKRHFLGDNERKRKERQNHHRARPLKKTASWRDAFKKSLNKKKKRSMVRGGEF